MIFIHKPVIFFKLSEIKYVELNRVGQFSTGIAGSSGKSFDMTITKLKDEAPVTFAGIDKEEHKNLENYFKSRNVRVRQT